MKRSRVVLFLSPSVVAFLVIAASCSEGTEKKQHKAATGRYYQPKDGGDGSSSSSSSSSSLEAGLPDAGEFELPRELKTPGEALHVLITAHDLEIKEAEFGKESGGTPLMAAYCGDLVKDVKAARSRVKALAARKKVTPKRSNMSERMRFESQAAIGHLKNIFRNMFYDTYINRRIDTANNLLRLIDAELAPLLTDDDYKQELATTIAELEKRISRAEAVKSGLADGPTGSEGMFEEIEGPTPPAGLPSPTEEPIAEPGDGGT